VFCSLAEARSGGPVLACGLPFARRDPLRCSWT